MIKKKSLKYHSESPAGKLEIIPTKKYNHPDYLSLAYSPGVAYVSNEIYKNNNLVNDYTNIKNLVGVITNGTAVLGLGNIGVNASKPVMEGKCMLFKILAGIDAYDIEISVNDPLEFINIVKKISCTFGAINLEDIKAPEAFIIENNLIEDLNIPIMHDDQHGTAIVSSAALINALELANKDISEITMLVSGAGAAALSCIDMYIELGVKKKNIYVFDSLGLISNKRKKLDKNKEKFVTFINNDDLKNDTSMLRFIDGIDVFIGLSVGNIINKNMLLKMNKNPIVFAMANPIPEIDYKTAKNIRSDVIMATGRSDTPNQVNNVLGYPYIFRGALDTYSSKINKDMKISAIWEIVNLTKKNVPYRIKKMYNNNNLSFGKEYLLPKPLDNRLLYHVSPAVAKAAIKSKVAKKVINDWEKYNLYLYNRLNRFN